MKYKLLIAKGNEGISVHANEQIKAVELDVIEVQVGCVKSSDR